MTTWMELVQVWVLPELIANGDLDGDRYFVCPERRIAIEEDPVEEDPRVQQGEKNTAIMGPPFSNL